MFITFEGGEGSGKSTQSKRLYGFLEQSGIPCLLTREPGGTEGAEAIRALLVNGEANRWDHVTEMLLHLAARRDHVEKVIRPALAAGTWVLCDRFIDSTIAYQGYGHGLGKRFIEIMHHLTHSGPYPHITFLLDIAPEMGLERAASRKGGENRYEQMDMAFHQRLRQGFLETAESCPERYHILDATRPEDVLQQEILAVIEKCLGAAKKPC